MAYSINYVFLAAWKASCICLLSRSLRSPHTVKQDICSLAHNPASLSGPIQVLVQAGLCQASARVPVRQSNREREVVT